MSQWATLRGTDQAGCYMAQGAFGQATVENRRTTFISRPSQSNPPASARRGWPRQAAGRL